MKKVFAVTLVLLLVLAGCQKQITPDLKPPKGGYVEYWYDEGGEILYGGSTPMVGPFSKPEKDLEEKCNYYLVTVNDENGKVIRSITRNNISNEWYVEEYCEDGGLKHTSYDGEMNFVSAEVNYGNEQHRLTKHLLLNEDDSVACADVTVYLEDGITRYQVFFYNEKGELVSWSEYLPPLYQEFVERDANEAPEEYLKLK